MNMKKFQHLLAGTLVGVMLASAMPAALAASHYNDSSATGGSAAWTAWTAAWAETAADLTKVSITPGADQTKLNFAWYSKEGGNKTPVVHFGTDKSALKTFTGTCASVDGSLTGGDKYDFNHVTVTGLKENTTYYYTVEKNGAQTAPAVYKTGSFENVSILYVGDPQIGASKGQTQNGEKLAAESGAKNTAARNDSFAWNRTLSIATAQNPKVNFIISAGDQVNKTGKPKEEEYAGFLAPAAMSSLAVATTIGNHDSLNPDYSYHFNNPNATQNGKTAAGGDYYYTYGTGLFIVLNTNNYNAAEHEKTIKEAVASAPKAQWRIVTIHQDIYGSGLDHSDTDGMILRTQLTPIFDKYNIDVVLQGHDHTYSRSKLLYGDGKTHGTYEFRLASDGSDYDWDNAYNTKTNEKIGLYPKDGDTAGTSALAGFAGDNQCYALESVSGTTVTDPSGILYMTANSATGSKYYELATTKQDYIADRSQNWLPSYSVINMTSSSFSISTYQITASGKTEQMDSTFTIKKTGAAVSADTALTRAQAVQRIYNAAGAPTVKTSASFRDVAAADPAATAIAWARANGITLGTSKTTFSPNVRTTAAQLSVMLARYAKLTGGAGAAVTGVTASALDYALTVQNRK